MKRKILSLLRGVKDTPVTSTVTSKIPSVIEYQLELTNKGKNQLHIKKSDDPKFVNYIHLWYDKKHYVGYLRKDTGKFVTKDQKIAQKHGIKEVPTELATVQLIQDLFTKDSTFTPEEWLEKEKFALNHSMSMFAGMARIRQAIHYANEDNYSSISG